MLRGNRYADFVRIHAFVINCVICGNGKIICLSANEVANCIARCITGVYGVQIGTGGRSVVYHVAGHISGDIRWIPCQFCLANGSGGGVEDDPSEEFVVGVRAPPSGVIVAVLKPPHHRKTPSC